MAKLIYTLIGINLTAFVVSGCMALVATPNGVREFYRGQNGLVVTGKASADKDDSYHRGQRWYDERSTLKLQVNPDGNL